MWHEEEILAKTARRRSRIVAVHAFNIHYTHHTQHTSPHHSPAQPNIAQLTTPHRQQASHCQCQRCDDAQSAKVHWDWANTRERDRGRDGEGEALRHTHVNIRTHSLRSCSAWAATFTWRILKRVTAIKATESAYAHHAHSSSAQKQNKTNSAIKNDKVAVAAQRAPLTQNGTNALSQPAALFTSLSSLFLSVTLRAHCNKHLSYFNTLML